MNLLQCIASCRRALVALRCIMVQYCRMRRVAYLAVAMFAMVALADESRLMPCPDCGKIVSKRALMCPGCGLKGEIIAEEAAKFAKAEGIHHQ